MIYKEMEKLKKGDRLWVCHERYRYEKKKGTLQEIKDVQDAYAYIEFDEEPGSWIKIYTGMQFMPDYFNASFRHTNLFTKITEEEEKEEMKIIFDEWLVEE